jgi:hypothetical protein
LRNRLILCGLLAISACRSSDNPPADFSVGVPDLSVGGLVDLAGDLTSPPDLKNADLYTPLFKAPMPFNVESGPIFVASGDLNKDGKRDLVVANSNNPPATPATVSVLLGNGDGTFQNEVSTNIDQHPSGIAIADLNGDTFPDVAVSVGDGFQVLLGSAGGTLGTPSKITIVPATTYVNSIALGDIDGDMKLDVVLADLGVATGKIWVSLGDGAGSFATPTSTEVTSSGTIIYSTFAARLGDMDGDGKLDVVTVNSQYIDGIQPPTSNTIAILKNMSSAGTVVFAAPQEKELGATPVPFDVLVDELDGAKRLDVVVLNNAANNINVFLSSSASGPPSFATPVPYTITGGPTAIAKGDIDGDSKADLVTVNAQSSNVTVLYGGAAGAFGTATANRPGSESYPTGLHPSSLVLGSFNSDSKIDIATADTGAGTVSVLLNQR